MQITISIAAIPALQPIVYDLFVLRSSTKADAFKDLETQREVVVSMLLRLIQYYQVIKEYNAVHEIDTLSQWNMLQGC